ncbi:MAG: hypothetical protein RL757_2773 [Bacteroidota bacterium]|jgi:hypothetical protein
MKKQNSILVTGFLCALLSCQNQGTTPQNASAAAATEAVKTVTLDPKYEQAAQEACNCMTDLADINRRRTEFAEKAKFDSVGTVPPDIRKAAFDSLMAMSRDPNLKKTALEAWKCFEARIGALGELDKNKFDEALKLRCPAYQKINEQGMNVAPTH